MSAAHNTGQLDQVDGFDAEALRSRVTLVADRWVLFREIRHQTPQTIDVMFDRMEELTEPWPTYVQVLDLRGVERPGPEARQRLRDRMRFLHPRVAHLAVAVGPSIVLRAVAKVFAVTLGLSSVSFHQTLEQAMDAAREAHRS